MKKTLLIIGLVVVVLAGGLFYFYQHSQSVKPVELTDSDFEIAGIKIDASREDVQKILGEPSAKNTSENNNSKYESWQYPDLTVVFKTGDNQSFVDSLTVTGQKYQTYRGIKVGDSSQSIKAKYGEGQQSESFYVYKEPSVRMIEFVINNSKANAIIVAKLMKP